MASAVAGCYGAGVATSGPAVLALEPGRSRRDDHVTPLRQAGEQCGIEPEARGDHLRREEAKRLRQVDMVRLGVAKEDSISSGSSLTLAM